MRRSPGLAALLAMTALNPAAEVRPRRERVIGPVRDLVAEIRVVLYVVRRDANQVGNAAQVLDGLLEERGLHPGCHTRQPGDPPLEGEQIPEWFAGQLPRIVEAQKLEALVRWVAQGLDLFGEERPRTVIVRTPEDAAKLTREDVSKLAKAEDRRERRAAKRRKEDR